MVGQKNFKYQITILAAINSVEALKQNVHIQKFYKLLKKILNCLIFEAIDAKNGMHND